MTRYHTGRRPIIGCILWALPVWSIVSYGTIYAVVRIRRAEIDYAETRAALAAAEAERDRMLRVLSELSDDIRDMGVAILAGDGEWIGVTVTTRDGRVSERLVSHLEEAMKP